MGSSRSFSSGVPAFRDCAARRGLAVPDAVELVRRARGFAAERSARDCRVVRRISVAVLRAPMVAFGISWCTVPPRKPDLRLQDSMRSVNILFNFFGRRETKKVLQKRKPLGYRWLHSRSQRNPSRLPVPRPGAVAHRVQVAGPPCRPGGGEGQARRSVAGGGNGKPPRPEFSRTLPAGGVSREVAMPAARG